MYLAPVASAGPHLQNGRHTPGIGLRVRSFESTPTSPASSSPSRLVPDADAIHAMSRETGRRARNGCYTQSHATAVRCFNPPALRHEVSDLLRHSRILQGCHPQPKAWLADHFRASAAGPGISRANPGGLSWRAAALPIRGAGCILHALRSGSTVAPACLAAFPEALISTPGTLLAGYDIIAWYRHRCARSPDRRSCFVTARLFGPASPASTGHTCPDDSRWPCTRQW